MKDKDLEINCLVSLSTLFLGRLVQVEDKQELIVGKMIKLKRKVEIQEIEISKNKRNWLRKERQRQVKGID